jgi:hypothetical protein
LRYNTERNKTTSVRFAYWQRVTADNRNDLSSNILCAEAHRVDGLKHPHHMLFTVELLRFVQLYKELSMTTDQKKHLRKLFQSFLDAVVELLQTEHAVMILVLLYFTVCLFFISVNLGC